MAELGKVCSQIGALLFTIEAGVRMVKSQTCTSLPCKWIMPATIKNVPYAEIRKIDFTAASAKKRKLDEQQSGLTKTTPNSKKIDYNPSETQKKVFLKKLHDSNTKPAILSLIPPYNKGYVETQLDLPASLDTCYDEELASLNHSDLLTKAEDYFAKISCTEQQVINVELLTKSQKSCPLWFKMRSGRITASNFHQACHTDVNNPSTSFIKRICYGSQFYSKATNWGCKKEKKALEKYKQVYFFLKI